MHPLFHVFYTMSHLWVCVMLNYREQLIKWFVDLQLSDYKVAFHESEEVGL